MVKSAVIIASGMGARLKEHTYINQKVFLK